MASKFVVLAVLATCFSSSLGQLSGVASSNPAGGFDVNVAASKFVGNPNHNIGAGLTAAGNTLNNNPASVGGFVDYNVNGHGLGISKTITPGVSDTFAQNARVNLINNNNHRLDANAFNSHTKLANGFEFDRRGGSLNYNHAAGHGASLGASHIPNFGTTADLAGKANLWRSNSGLSSLDLTGTASRTLSGPFSGRNNFGAGLGFNHRF